MAELLGRPVSEQDRQRLVAGLPGRDATMLQIQEAGRAIGIELRGVGADLTALASDVPGPKILHLSNPDHFLVLARASEELAQVVDGGRVGVLPIPALAARYSGHALIAEIAVPPAAPRLEVEHTFDVRNAGTEDLVLRVKDCGG
jgi:ABC-type bacteriocin/lantibiotic exporter with double-glycine peptidase domain